MKEPFKNHLIYWSSMLASLLIAGLVISWDFFPFTTDLAELFVVGVFFFHLAAGQYLGYSGVLKKKYQTVPWRRHYQRSLAVSFGLMGLGWVAGSILPQGIGIYAVIIAMGVGLLYSNRALGRFVRGDYPRKNNEKED